jgi:hypothetical protein
MKKILIIGLAAIAFALILTHFLTKKEEVKTNTVKENKDSVSFGDSIINIDTLVKPDYDYKSMYFQLKKEYIRLKNNSNNENSDRNNNNNINSFNNNVINSQNRNNHIIVNDQEYDVSGNNIIINDGQVIVDGKVIKKGVSGTIKVIFKGDLASLRCGSATVYGNIKGDVDCTSLNCGDVGGDVDATSVQCKNVSGDIDATSVIKN